MNGLKKDKTGQETVARHFYGVRVAMRALRRPLEKKPLGAPRKSAFKDLKWPFKR